MSFKWVLLILVFFSGVISPAIAVAQDLHERGIRTEWVVSEIDLLEEQNNPSVDGTERTIKSDGLVMQQRLLPPSAAKLTEAITDDDGDTVAQAGDELYGVLAGSGRVYCLNEKPEINPVGALFVGAVLQAKCFKDVDGDGVFDGSFKKKLGNGFFPQLSGKHRKKLRQISGGSFETIDPRDLKRAYYVAVKFEGRGFLGLASSRFFSVEFGGDDASSELTRQYSTKGDDLPSTVEISGLGASFTVLGFEDDAIRVRIDDPFDEQPFAVSTRVTIR
ncbi:hypothetical protein EH31_07660 [Erythrobacter longus]|uniref:Uncharacterized protein n=1 Tax=Erythrobacter longus TaxID=1044 RepID=A0A074MDQ8_ERYLO|nr:hypothetical protein [Erythrobacter longus]KEO90905.1 hypothetical protein EH31_07660 [Erythrobacter longus]